MAYSHLELYLCSSNNSNGGHFGEWSYCTHNGCTQSAAMAWGVCEHKWGLVYNISMSPLLSRLCLVCAHMHKILSLYSSPSLFRVWFVKQFAVTVARVHKLQLQPISLSSLTLRQLSSCSNFTPHPSANVSLTLAQSLFSTPFPTPKYFLVWLACPTVSYYPRLSQPCSGAASGKPTHLRMCLLVTHGYQPAREA